MKCLALARIVSARMKNSTLGYRTIKPPAALGHPESSIVRRIIVLVILALGLPLWLRLAMLPGGPWLHAVILLLAAAVAVYPPLRARISTAMERLRDPSSRRAWTIAALVALVGGGYLFLTAWLQDSDLMLKLNDEFSYMIQMQMLARGKLWQPALAAPVREFFESFQILVDPKYGSIYFPGTALLYLPTIWLGLPFWVMPLCVSAACVGLFYRVVRELIDGVAGLLAALLLISMTKFRALSVMLLSQTPMLFFALLIVLIWLRWRKDRGNAWALAMGFFGGWATITRPVETLCFAVPLAFAMFWEMRGMLPRRIVATLGLIVLAAVPFLTVQAIHNWGMTGSWRVFASDYYVARMYPASMIGFHKIDWDHLPPVRAVDKRITNETITYPLYREHQIKNVISEWQRFKLGITLDNTLPASILLLPLPLSFLMLRQRMRWVFAAPVVGFIGFYVIYVFYYPHYLIVIAPPVLFLVLLGVEAIAQTWPGHRQAISVLTTLLVAGVCLASLPEFHRDVRDEYDKPEQALFNAALSKLPGGRAGVFVGYVSYGDRYPFIPIYTTTAVNPDDARVLLARDWGDRENSLLYRYYAERQPHRHFYRYDAFTHQLLDLGTAAAMHAKFPVPKDLEIQG